jgi:hypothetical protein
MNFKLGKAGKAGKVGIFKVNDSLLQVYEVESYKSI